MDNLVEEMLKECGDLGPYQYVMLGSFCLINIFASIHYFSQTLILFVPEHWLVLSGFGFYLIFTQILTIFLKKYLNEKLKEKLIFNESLKKIRIKNIF